MAMKFFAKDAGHADMTQGKIFPVVVAFAIPLLIGNLFQLLYNVVDSMVIGNFVGTDALAAVGASNSPIMVLFSLLFGVSNGASILVSQYFGAHEPQKVREAVATIGSFFLLSIVPLTVLGLLLIDPLLRLIGAQGAVFDYAQLYLRILFGGTAVNFGFLLNSGLLRGLGDSRSPLLFLLIACIINIILDLLFVLVFDWGVFGVGIGTIIAQGVSWLYSLHHIRKNYPELDYKFFRLSINKVHLKKIIGLGLPIAFNQGVYALGFLVYYRFIIGFGPAFMAGYTSASKLDNFTWLPVSSLATAATTFAGQNSGAGNLERLNQGSKIITRAAVICSMTTAAIVLLFGRKLMLLFTPDLDVIEAGYNFLFCLEPFYWYYAIMGVLSAYMNGAGDVRVPTIITMIMFWAVRLPVAWYLSSNLPSTYLHLAFPISWFVGSTLMILYFRTGRWKRHLEAKPQPQTEVSAP